MDKKVFTLLATIKGTVARDFRPLVFSTNRPYIVPEFTPKIFLNSVSNSRKYSYLKLFPGVWYPAELCSAGSDTRQDFVLRNIRPRRTLFCGVSGPAGRCSAGYQTPQNKRLLSNIHTVIVLRDMIPRGTTFEYLGEFEMEIKKIFGHESGADMGLIHEKNKRSKISCYCTFK